MADKLLTSPCKELVRSYKHKDVAVATSLHQVRYSHLAHTFGIESSCSKDSRNYNICSNHT